MRESVRRSHKDSLFRMIFREKESLLSLYNAINGTAYKDVDRLEVNTIEDVLYMGMKNDVSFLVDDVLNLYEAQSTENPNMPLRGLFYFSKFIRGMLRRRNPKGRGQGILTEDIEAALILCYNKDKPEVFVKSV